MSADPRPIRVGVVGCGTIAYWAHLRVLRRLSGATLIAAADPDAEARERARRLTGLAIHADAEELLARDDLDAVVLCPATPVHAAVAIAACRRGKAFYLEKPIATCAEESRSIVAAAADAGVVGVVGFNRRHNPTHERARELIASGRIGRVQSVLTAFCEPLAAKRLPEWKRRRRSGGGALLDLASHHVDLVRWFLGDEIAEVEARIASEASEEDSAWLRLATTGGVEVRSVFSFRSGPADWLVFLGERGTIQVDRLRGSVELCAERRFGYGVRRVFLAPRLENFGWRVRRLASPSYDPSYARALGAFVGELQGGPATTARLADGVINLDVLLAAEEAALRGRPVAVARTCDASAPRH